jgi:probable phosphoglycerate mutase
VSAERVVVLRHGRTGHNLRHVWQGQLDVPLDDVGVRQAAAVARVLARLSPVTVVASDLVRASATADVVAAAAGVPVTLDPRLQELDVGRWQGLTRAEIVATGDGDLLAAWRGGEDVAVGGAERPSELGRRGAQALREHAEKTDGGTLVVVAHGALLRAATMTLVGLDQPQWKLLAGLPNCGWGVLEPGQPAWRLLAWGLTAPELDGDAPRAQPG